MWLSVKQYSEKTGKNRTSIYIDVLKKKVKSRKIKKDLLQILQIDGWRIGLEPTFSAATVQRSTIKLSPPFKKSFTNLTLLVLQ